MIGTLSNETEKLLAQGQDAARKGDKPGARSFLTQVVERDPHNELAWMWLSGVVESPEEQQLCLENVLVINPHNDKARRGLDYISTKTGIPVNLPSEAPEQMLSASEFTAPLTADSPMYGELSGHSSTWSSSGNNLVTSNAAPAVDGEDPTLAFLSLMQNGTVMAPDAPSTQDASFMAQFAGNDGGVAPIPPWGVQSEALQQEQLNWDQPGDDFSMLSIADGVDDRLASFDTLGGSLPPWADSGVSPEAPYNADPFSMNIAPADTAGATASGSAGAAMSPFGGMSNMPDMGPMGMHSDSNLPSPSDLPRFEEPSEQPWYLRSENQVSPEVESPVSIGRASEASDGRMQTGAKGKSETATIECPHCHASVADTSLSCPQCRYNFFVNCPHCHELVDAADAKEGKTVDCPYCQKPINKLELGMAGTDSVISYKSTKASGDAMSKQAMEDLEASQKVKRQISFRWLVDVAWLVAIIATVWALSQIPTWLHLTGQY